MICDKCHQRPACVHLRTINPEGKTSTLNLCAACAMEELAGAQGAQDALHALRMALKETGMKLPDLDKHALLEAATTLGNLIPDSDKGQGSSSKPQECPKCKLTLEDFKENFRLRCPECVPAFQSELEEHLHGDLWQGKVPLSERGVASKNPERQLLLERIHEAEVQLKAAVKDEKYEEAGVLKREIADLRKQASEFSEEKAQAALLEALYQPLPNAYGDVLPWFPRTPRRGSIIRLSSFISYSRNISGYPTHPGGPKEREKFQELSKRLVEFLISDPLFSGAQIINPQSCSPEQKMLLVARSWVPETMINLPYNARLVVSPNHKLVAKVNYREHLEIVIHEAPGEALKFYPLLQEFDRRLQGHFSFIVSPDYGIFTHLPQTLGSGFLFGEYLHLPGLTIEGHNSAISAACSNLQTAFNGAFHDDVVDSCGIYLLYNSNSLGGRLTQKGRKVTTIAKILEKRELDARANLLSHQETRLQLTDRLGRVAGTVKGARLVENAEALFLLSFLWFGKELGVYPNISHKQIFTTYPKILELTPNEDINDRPLKDLEENTARIFRQVFGHEEDTP